MPDGNFDGMVIADVMRHMPYPEHGKIIEDVYRK